MTGSGLTVWPVRGPHPSAHRMIRARSTGRVAPMMIRVVGRAWRKCWWWVLGIAAGLAGVVANRRMDHNARPRPSSSVDEGDWSGPDEYERLTSISKESYEWRLLVAAQSHLMGEWTVTPDNAPPYTPSPRHNVRQLTIRRYVIGDSPSSALAARATVRATADWPIASRLRRVTGDRRPGRGSHACVSAG